MANRGAGGKREDLDNIFFRSKWEANYARYLNWLVSKGELTGWLYEADEFEFKPIKKGTRFYKPDFKVWHNDGSIVYHEVKGWNDARSQTRAKRMAKYYPDVKIILIDKEWFRSANKQLARLITNWE